MELIVHNDMVYFNNTIKMNARMACKSMFTGFKIKLHTNYKKEKSFYVKFRELSKLNNISTKEIQNIAFCYAYNSDHKIITASSMYNKFLFYKSINV